MPIESQKLSISLKRMCNQKPQVTTETPLKEYICHVILEHRICPAIFPDGSHLKWPAEKEGG